MNKQSILELTGLSEDDFYNQYPDQASFCSDYPDMCGELMEAQNGINVEIPENLRNRVGVNTQGNVGMINYTPQLQPMVRDESGTFKRPRSFDRMGRAIGPMVETFDKIPTVNEPGGYINPDFEGYASNQPTAGWQTSTGMWSRPGMAANTPYIDRSKTLQPLKVLAPIVNNYNLPKELIKNNLQTVPLKDFGAAKTLQSTMSPAQTMREVGAIGASYSTPLNKYSSIVDLLKSKGKDSSFAERKKLAESYGLKNYTGSATQNNELINYVSKMKQGGQPCYECGGMYEKGGTAIFPAMRTMFKKGGYYGMDGKFHRNTDSGTYVPGSGYYFQNGSTVTSSTPPTSGSPVDVSAGQSWSASGDGSYNIDTNFQYDIEDENQESGIYGDGVNGSRRNRRNELYESPDLGGLNMDEEQYDEEQQNIEPFDSSQYSNAVDPNTGFTTWSKDNKQLTNIKKQDPELWEQLKEEGKGARFRTGQTDIQKFGRTAGKIANTMQTGVELAGTIGNVLNERNRKRNMDAAAMNMGSTAAMFTNPQGSSKGDYGVTGSTYGAFKPYNVGTFSYKGMYGKYGMEVPSYQVGGGFSNLFASPQLAAPISSPMELMPNIPFTQLAAPIVDNTAVYRTNQKVNNTSSNIPSGTLNVDAALQAVAGVESSSKPGESKTGLRTKIVGEGGKKASASGTYQITNPTLQDIYNIDKSISSKYDTFKQFKSAFDTDPKVEYEAARSLMSRYIKNYGVFALGAWYYPEFARRAAKGDKSVFDITPRRDFGNSVTWGDDFNKKLNAYNKLAGTNYTPNTTFNIQTSTTPTNANFSLKNLINFSKTNGWNVTSTTGGDHNVGSKHGKGRAIDVSVKNKTPQQIADFMKLAQSQGYRVLDERVRPKGQKKWDGAHLHLDFKTGGQLGGQVVEMDEDEIKQFLAAGGQLEFID
jgi:hypothetical protein